MGLGGRGRGRVVLEIAKDSGIEFKHRIDTASLPNAGRRSGHVGMAADVRRVEHELVGVQASGVRYQRRLSRTDSHNSVFWRSGTWARRDVGDADGLHLSWRCGFWTEPFPFFAEVIARAAVTPASGDPELAVAGRPVGGGPHLQMDHVWQRRRRLVVVARCWDFVMW